MGLAAIGVRIDMSCARDRAVRVQACWLVLTLLLARGGLTAPQRRSHQVPVAWVNGEDPRRIVLGAGTEAGITPGCSGEVIATTTAGPQVRVPLRVQLVNPRQAAAVVAGTETAAVRPGDLAELQCGGGEILWQLGGRLPCEDDDAFARARHDVQALRRYVEHHPLGCHVEEAWIRLTKLEEAAIAALIEARQAIIEGRMADAQAAVQRGESTGAAADWPGMRRAVADRVTVPTWSDVDAQLRQGDLFACSRSLESLVVTDPLDGLAEVWRVAIAVKCEGPQLAQLEELKRWSDVEGAGGRLARRLLSWLGTADVAKAGVSCPACGFRQPSGLGFCMHCLWMQWRWSEIRFSSGQARTLLHGSTPVPELIATASQPAAARMAPGPRREAPEISWSVTTDSLGMIATFTVNSEAGREAGDTLPGCETVGTIIPCSTRSSSYHVRLPRLEERAATVERVLLELPTEPSTLVHPSNMIPYHPWWCLEEFVVQHDERGRISQLKGRTSGCEYQFEYAQELLTRIANPATGFSRTMEYVDGRLRRERLVLEEGGEEKLIEVDWANSARVSRIEGRIGGLNIEVDF